MSFFSKIKSGLGDLYNLGKSVTKSPLFNKAKSWLSSSMDVINNKNTKKLVQNLGSYVPQVKDFYKDVRKYGNIGDQFLNKGGAEKFIDRGLNKVFPIIGNLKNFQDRIKGQRSNVELQPKAAEPSFNMSPIFG